MIGISSRINATLAQFEQSDRTFNVGMNVVYRIDKAAARCDVGWRRQTTDPFGLFLAVNLAHEVGIADISAVDRQLATFAAVLFSQVL